MVQERHCHQRRIPVLRLSQTFSKKIVEETQGYAIRQSVPFDNGRGFALGENSKAPNPFVIWQFTEEQGNRDHYWGHYHNDGAAVEKDFSSRISDYQRRYGMREIRQPIAKQMREVGTLAKEKQPDKVLESPNQRRSREREER